MIKPSNASDIRCEGGLMERPRYFPRQLVTPDDMNLAQEYFRRKLRLHNRMLHGWGVVCGAEVCRVQSPQEPPQASGATQADAWKVKITRGYVLGPYGDEIWIDCDHAFDIRRPDLTGAPGELAEQALDPWCRHPQIKPDQKTIYIAVKYKEIKTRPVRSQPVGCGYDETQCEYSRWRDSYEFGVLPACPSSHQEPPSHWSLFQGDIPDCPPCPNDPWVVLAEVLLSPEGKGIEGIRNCSCRRQVASLAGFWWQCGEDEDDRAQRRISQVEIGRLADASKLPGKLISIGIDTPAKLLEKAATIKQRVDLISKLGEVKPEELESMVSTASLIRAEGVDIPIARILNEHGIRTIKELAGDTDVGTRAKEVHEKLSNVASKPTLSEVTTWIKSAKLLTPLVISSPSKRPTPDEGSIPAATDRPAGAGKPAPKKKKVATKKAAATPKKKAAKKKAAPKKAAAKKKSAPKKKAAPKKGT